MSANFGENFKGLPQEVVDEILEYLEDDRRALRACSLTCKVLFRSSRPIIYRRLTRFHMLLAAAERGLTRYTRELTIKFEFRPVDLQPMLPHLQTFARLTSLTLHRFNPSPFLPLFERYFGHLAQQIRSLNFVDPSGHRDDLLCFVSRFQNLDDLGFFSFPRSIQLPLEEYNTPPIRGSPYLRGTLRVVRMMTKGDDFLKCLTRLPSGLGFRSIEFHDCAGIDPNIILRKCSSTLQNLTHTTHISKFR